MQLKRKIFSRSLALFGGALGVLLVFCGVQAQVPPSVLITLSITTPQHAISPNAACNIAIKVTNISAKPIMLRVNNDAMDMGKNWKIKVVDKSSGAPLKLKESVANQMPTLYTQHSSFRFKRLKPNESFTRVIDISKLFDLSRPGTYQVQVRRHIPKEYGGETVSSNKVDISIAP